jgi:hypothetical protein
MGVGGYGSVKGGSGKGIERAFEKGFEAGGGVGGREEKDNPLRDPLREPFDTPPTTNANTPHTNTNTNTPHISRYWLDNYLRGTEMEIYYVPLGKKYCQKLDYSWSLIAEGFYLHWESMLIGLCSKTEHKLILNPSSADMSGAVDLAEFYDSYDIGVVICESPRVAAKIARSLLDDQEVDRIMAKIVIAEEVFSVRMTLSDDLAHATQRTSAKGGGMRGSFLGPRGASFRARRASADAVVGPGLGLGSGLGSGTDTGRPLTAGAALTALIGDATAPDPAPAPPVRKSAFQELMDQMRASLASLTSSVQAGAGAGVGGAAGAGAGLGALTGGLAATVDLAALQVSWSL